MSRWNRIPYTLKKTRKESWGRDLFCRRFIVFFYRIFQTRFIHVMQICKSVASWTLTIPISLYDFVSSFIRVTRNYYRKRNYDKFENIYHGVIWMLLVPTPLTLELGTCNSRMHTIKLCRRCLVRSNAADITIFCNSVSIQWLETVR